MTGRFHLLPLMVLGFCNAFELFPPEDKPPNYSAGLIDLPRWASAKAVHSHVVEPLTNSWGEEDPNNPDNFYRARRSFKPTGSVSETHSNSKHLHNSIRDSLASKLNHAGKLSNRRFFLEPIIDGKIIGSIGKLFGDNTKEEADRERVEREKIREEELLKKYMEMLNDPKQLAELEREAANSPGFINQTIRRSFSPSFNEPIENNVAKESSRRHRFHFDVSARDRGGNQRHRYNDYKSFKPLSEHTKKYSVSKMTTSLDNFGRQTRRMLMDFSYRRKLVTSDNNGESDETTIFFGDHTSLASLFDGVDKERWNLWTNRDSDETIPIETFPLYIHFVRSRSRPSTINFNRNRYQLWRYPKHITVEVELVLKDV